MTAAPGPSQDGMGGSQPTSLSPAPSTGWLRSQLDPSAPLVPVPIRALPGFWGVGSTQTVLGSPEPSPCANLRVAPVGLNGPPGSQRAWKEARAAPPKPPSRAASRGQRRARAWESKGCGVTLGARGKLGWWPFQPLVSSLCPPPPQPPSILSLVCTGETQGGGPPATPEAMTFLKAQGPGGWDAL